jgi:hypothetical protein
VNPAAADSESYGSRTVVELIFVACLTLAPDSCEERSKVHAAEIGIMGCMLTAQAELAAWTESHRDFEVTRWSCRWMGSAGLAA